MWKRMPLPQRLQVITLPEHIEIYDNEFIKIGECLRLDNTEIKTLKYILKIKGE